MTQPSPSKKPVWISRGYKFKLDPTPAQADSLARHVGVCRVIYNLALEQRRDHYRQFKASTGKVISFASQCRELTLLRAEFDWIRSVGVTCQEQALRDLDTAFQGFFSGRGGYPQFRKRGVNDSFRFKGREVAVRRLNKSWGVVKLFKIGEVRFRWTRGIEGKVKAATINLDSLGWHVSFSTEAEADIEAGENPAIGIDRGVAQAVAYSDGSFAAFPKERIATLEAKVRRASAALSRCVKGSNRRKVAKARVAALRSRMARVRKHFNHVETTRVARSFSVVCIERLNTKGMTASARGTIEQPIPPAQISSGGAINARQRILVARGGEDVNQQGGEVRPSLYRWGRVDDEGARTLTTAGPDIAARGRGGARDYRSQDRRQGFPPYPRTLAQAPKPIDDEVSPEAFDTLEEYLAWRDRSGAGGA
jgi:putative transposase